METKAKPWTLKTPGGGAEYTAYRDEAALSLGLLILRPGEALHQPSR